MSMTKKIPLTQGKFAIVDAVDFKRVIAFGKWYAAKNNKGHTWYAQRVYGPKRRRKVIQLHRFILNAPANAEVDHRNGNGLDCRRSNMRICNTTQNRRNRKRNVNNKSGFKGVHAQGAKWRARLSIGPRSSRFQLSLGMFDTPEEAAMAYDAAVINHHGEFANLNFPVSS